MIQKTPKKWNTVGFTLLEILLAVTIFAVVITTVYGALRAVLSKNEAIRQGSDIYEMARICLNRIVFDLTSVYVESPPLYKPPGFTEPPDPYCFVGEESYVGAKKFSRLRFASTAHLPMAGRPEKGIAEIVYYVKEREEPQSDCVLKRADALCSYDEKYRFEEKDTDPVLCEQVEDFSLTYFDEEGEAYEKWDSDSDGYQYATPRSVEVKLTIGQNSQARSFYTRVTLPVYREDMKDTKK